MAVPPEPRPSIAPAKREPRTGTGCWADRCGAVSRHVAVAMAERALAHSHADVSCAITGFAGPRASGDEVGLVHLATTLRSGDTCHEEHHFGAVGRGPVRVESLRVALRMLAVAVGEHAR